MTKKYWKVVRKDLKSLTILYDEFVVQYKINEWVRPTYFGTKLFVFTSFFEAQKYHEGHPSSRMFVCEVLKPNKKYRLFYNAFWASHDTITLEMVKHRVKKRLNKKKFNYTTPFFPKDTICVDAVKLTKEL